MSYNPKVLKGEILNFTYGEYSDFGNWRILVFVKNCNLEDLAAEYRRTFEPVDEWDEPEATNFPTFLVIKGYAMPVTAREFHLGDYNNWFFDTE